MPRYFSANPPALVTRFGTGTYLGATLRVVSGQPVIEWDSEKIVEISDAELVSYLREYAGLIRDGSLIERTKEDYQIFCELEAEDARRPVIAAVIAAPEPEAEASTLTDTAAPAEPEPGVDSNA